MTATSADAAKYLPDEFQDVRAKLAGLQAAFEQKDYNAVIAAAPAVLASAQGLAAAAAAKKTEVKRALSADWSSLAGSLPDEAIALQRRIELLGKKSSRATARGIDVPAAKTALRNAASLWSKAQAAFASGNLEEAVRTAKGVKTELAAVADSVKLKLPQAALPSPAAN